LRIYCEIPQTPRKLKEQIAKTEKMREQALADLKAGATTSASGDRSAATPPDVDSRDGAAMIQLQGQWKGDQIEIANREREIAAQTAKVNDYRGRLNLEPVLEQ
jgi:hypothetical protein